MWAVVLIALAWIIEIGWVISYVIKYRYWKSVIRSAEERQGGPTRLDARTLVAIHDVRQLNRDEAWFNAYLLYHLPVSLLVRLATGRFHILHRGGHVIFIPNIRGHGGPLHPARMAAVRAANLIPWAHRREVVGRASPLGSTPSPALRTRGFRRISLGGTPGKTRGMFRSIACSILIGRARFPPAAPNGRGDGDSRACLRVRLGPATGSRIRRESRRVSIPMRALRSGHPPPDGGLAAREAPAPPRPSWYHRPSR